MQKILQGFISTTFLVAGFLMLLPSLAAAQQQNISQGSASLNWAGYVAQNQNDSYTSVSGSWVVPTVSNTPASTADATWVGIGGVASTDLIQAGTQAIVSSGGSVTYEAWIETLPSFSKTVPLAVKSGDEMTASITQQSTGQWLITIIDDTTGQQYQTTVSYNSSLSSAEWIEEMVSNGNNTFRPLDNFGSVSFTGASAVVNGQSENLAGANAQPLSMINYSGQSLANVSAMGGDDASFSVTRTSAAASTQSNLHYRGRRWRVVNTATSTGSTGSMPSSTNVTIYRSGFGNGNMQQFIIPGFGVFSVMWR